MICAGPVALIGQTWNHVTTQDLLCDYIVWKLSRENTEIDGQVKKVSGVYSIKHVKIMESFFSHFKNYLIPI